MAREPESTRTVQRAVGLRIRELRRAKGLTQESAAEALDMLTPNYARIEQGRQNVTLDTLVRIAGALGVRTAELFRAPRTGNVKPGRPKGAARGHAQKRSAKP